VVPIVLVPHVVRPPVGLSKQVLGKAHPTRLGGFRVGSVSRWSRNEESEG
jgi:hypothetical protein